VIFKTVIFPGVLCREILMFVPFILSDVPESKNRAVKTRRNHDGGRAPHILDLGPAWRRISFIVFGFHRSGTRWTGYWLGLMGSMDVMAKGLPSPCLELKLGRLSLLVACQ
jgi:hypothetical protein